jgi:hypothetical protein
MSRDSRVANDWPHRRISPLRHRPKKPEDQAGKPSFQLRPDMTSITKESP